MHKISLILPVICVGMLLFSACAKDKPLSPEESIQATLAILSEAIEAKDADAVMELLSPDFYHKDIGRRSDAYAMMVLTLESGHTGGFRLDFSTAIIEFSKETGLATVAALKLIGPQKAYPLSLTLEPSLDNSNWHIFTFEISEETN
jgi:hypothetical protein